MTLGYGQDTWCLDSLSPGRYARGATLVAQALYRRLITPRGTLRGGDEEGAYGFDVSSYCGAVGYPIALAALPGQVRAELLKDDRVAEVTVNAAMADAGTGEFEITLSIDVVLADAGEAFSLTLGINDVTVAILGGLP